MREIEPFASERGYGAARPDSELAAGVPPEGPMPVVRPRPLVKPGKRPETTPTAVLKGRVPRRLFGTLFFAFILLGVGAAAEELAERRARDATAIIMAQTR